MTEISNVHVTQQSTCTPKHGAQFGAGNLSLFVSWEAANKLDTTNTDIIGDLPTLLP